MKKRTFIGALATGSLGIAARAQSPAYPAKPIRLVMGFTLGGAADYVARAISESLARNLGQPIMVENRAGCGFEHRRRHGGQVGARWLHGADCQSQQHLRQPRAQPEAGIQLARPGPDHQGDQLAPGACGQSGHRNQFHTGPHCQSQEIPTGCSAPPPAMAALRIWAPRCFPRSPEQFAAFLEKDARFWVKLVKDAGVKLD